MDEQRFHQLISGQSQTAGGRLLRFLLRGAAVPYGLAMRLRNGWYDRGLTVQDCGVPVISIGNLTAGGTGKTPLVAWAVQQLQELGRKPGIVSRGFGVSSSVDSSRGNDEKRVLELLCPGVPHVQNPDRVAAAGTCIDQFGVDALVADDAFQHRRLGRAVDVVLIDATCPWGHGFVHPRGLLREPARGLRRANVVVLTRSDLVGEHERDQIWQEVQRLSRRVSVERIEVAFQPTGIVDTAGNRLTLDTGSAARRVTGFCGIGNPESFRATLKIPGFDVTGFVEFPDHHAYDQGDMDRLAAQASEADSSLITTMKDLVKLSDLSCDVELRAVEIQPQFLNGEHVLAERVASAVEDTQGP